QRLHRLDQLEPGDVVLGVEAEAALGAAGGSDQPDLAVVADCAQGQPGALGDLADLHLRPHARTSRLRRPYRRVVSGLTAHGPSRHVRVAHGAGQGRAANHRGPGSRQLLRLDGAPCPPPTGRLPPPSPGELVTSPFAGLRTGRSPMVRRKARTEDVTSVLGALRDPRRLRTEVLAALVVALALVPEAISFSIIAGVDPRVGLFASFTMAVSIAFLGGRPAMISAATGAVALVIAPVMRDHGM